MNIINYSVIGNKLRYLNGESPVTGTLNADRCIFSFDNDWDYYEKKAVFSLPGGEEYEQILTNDKCFIPPDVLREPGLVKIGITGISNSGIVNATNYVGLRIIRGANENAAYSYAFRTDSNRFSDEGGVG